MTDAVWHEYTGASEFAESCASAIGEIIAAAIDAQGSALIAVPGGSTPEPILKRLARMKLDWAQVTIIPGDDRLVAQDDPLSNSAMIARLLGPTGATIMPLFGQDLDKDTATAEASTRLSALRWPPDLVWLGVGGDGHTASIFPGPDYDKALTSDNRTVALTPDPLPPEAPVPRITLTRSAIRAARHLFVTITGEAKRDVLKQALAEGNDSAFPAGRVLAGTTPDIYWRP